VPFKRIPAGVLATWHICSGKVTIRAIEQASLVADGCAARVKIEILRTPYRPPRANATCERFLRSVRQECLDRLLIFHVRQLQDVLDAYVAYFNQARPHQGIQQQIPGACGLSRPSQHAADKVIAVPILGGLHHDYQWVA